MRWHILIKSKEMELTMLPMGSATATDAAKTACQAAAEYGIDVCQLEYLLTLAPLERLMRHDAALAFVRAAREAGIQYYGFDPRHPETP